MNHELLEPLPPDKNCGHVPADAAFGDRRQGEREGVEGWLLNKMVSH